VLKKILSTIALGAMLTSCETLIGLDQKYNTDEINIDKPHFSLVFSSSIMGETHPCGCRHFPLGGLPQVAGLFEDLKKEKEILYVDTGDTLFPSSVIPKHLQKSLTFAAMNLAMGLDKLGLKYMVPGDQDLALGWGFLRNVEEKVKFKFLISNLSDDTLIKHKKYVILEFGEKKIFMLGLLDPMTLQQGFQPDFISPTMALEKILPELKEQGYDSKNKNHLLFALSHSGMDADVKLVEKFPQINWVVGSHSQSFTNFPNEVGSTKLVQVLSKNHYIGEIMIPTKVEIKEPFKYHEIREELKKQLEPNPFIAFIDDHKAQIEKIRDEEQKFFMTTSASAKKIKTAQSCLECHTDQGDHWQKTPHSIAFATLLINNEHNNTSCIGCHSVGMGKDGGFINFKDIVHMKDQAKADSYWTEVKKAFTGVESIRKLKKTEVVKLGKKWSKLDEKYEVTTNFANVQCLNCHNQHQDHPFSVGEGEKTKEQRHQEIKNNCLSCHTKEQSPEWYDKDKNGMSLDASDSKIKSMMKNVGCPAK